MSEVMRDWDAERSERYPEPITFKILGEVFTVVEGMSPEEFSEKARPYFEMTSDTKTEEATAIADAFIIAFLADDDREERWRAVRAQRNPAVSARDMREMISWILEQQTGVPTTQPEPSLNGDEAAGENSTESSSSEVEESEASVA